MDTNIPYSRDVRANITSLENIGVGSSANGKGCGDTIEAGAMKIGQFPVHALEFLT